jgi:hypothetical protein
MAIEIPTQLKTDDFRFVLVKPRDKKAFELQWQKGGYGYNDSILLNHIKNGGNYGVLCGYKNLIVLDFDDDGFQQNILPLLPKTFTVKSGGKGLLHKYFRCENIDTKRIKNKDGKTLVDIQSSRTQVVGPSSIRETGNTYQVVDDSPIATIDANFLNETLQMESDEHIKKSVGIETDEVCTQIKKAISVPRLMAKYGYDMSRNPTMCKLGHPSIGQSCFSYNDGLWHCFNCGESGNIFHFIMEHDKVGFIEAKEKLGLMAGIEDPLARRIAPDKEGEQVFMFSLAEYQRNLKFFVQKCPFFYDNNKIFWIWNTDKNCWGMADETTLMMKFEKIFNLDGETIPGKIKNDYLEGMRRVGRDNVPRDMPKSWVQFKDKIFDYRTRQFHNVGPEYFCCNPLPFCIGESHETPVMDKLFSEWVGRGGMQTLKEIIAYCCVANYDINLIFALVGSGRNGKSRFLALVDKFVGSDN